MEIRFQKAERKRGFANIALCGPSKAGKTYSALGIASGLCKAKGGKIALIDSENESSTLYSDKFNFDTLAARTGDPQFYFDALKAAETQGYEVVIIDSATPLWEGADGLLDKQSEREKVTKNSYTSWKDITPIYRRIIHSFRNSPFHLICTFRSKTEYVLEPNEKGKMVPRKVGLAPIFRKDVEYEFDLFGELNWDNECAWVGRMDWLNGRLTAKPGEAIGNEIRDWLYSGKEVTAMERYRNYIIATPCSVQGKVLSDLTVAEIELLLAQHGKKFLPEDQTAMIAFVRGVKEFNQKLGQAAKGVQ